MSLVSSYDVLTPNTFEHCLKEHRASCQLLELFPSITTNPQTTRTETKAELEMWSCCICHAADPSNEAKGEDSWLEIKADVRCRRCAHRECGLCFRFTGSRLRVSFADGTIRKRLTVDAAKPVDTIPWFEWAALSDEPLFLEPGPRRWNSEREFPVRTANCESPSLLPQSTTPAGSPLKRKPGGANNDAPSRKRKKKKKGPDDAQVSETTTTAVGAVEGLGPSTSGWD